MCGDHQAIDILAKSLLRDIYIYIYILFEDKIRIISACVTLTIIE